MPTRKPNKLLSIRLPSDMEQPFAGSSGQDDTGYKQHIEKLDQQEATLKYLLRRWVAGFLTICTVVVLTVFVLHMVLPTQWRWLSPEEVAEIKSVALTVFGGLAMSIGTLFYSRK